MASKRQNISHEIEEREPINVQAHECEPIKSYQLIRIHSLSYSWTLNGKNETAWQRKGRRRKDRQAVNNGLILCPSLAFTRSRTTNPMMLSQRRKVWTSLSSLDSFLATVNHMNDESLERWRWIKNRSIGRSWTSITVWKLILFLFSLLIDRYAEDSNVMKEDEFTSNWPMRHWMERASFSC